MATPTLAGFKARFPEFEALGISDATIQVYLDDAISHLDEEAWGDCYELAAYYWAAHMLTLAEENKNRMIEAGLGGSINRPVGPVTSSSADGLSVGYGADSLIAGSLPYSDAWYAQTRYGQYYLTLRAECVSGNRVASCG